MLGKEIGGFESRASRREAIVAHFASVLPRRLAPTGWVGYLDAMCLDVGTAVFARPALWCGRGEGLLGRTTRPIMNCE